MMFQPLDLAGASSRVVQKTQHRAWHRSTPNPPWFRVVFFFTKIRLFPTSVPSRLPRKKFRTVSEHAVDQLMRLTAMDKPVSGRNSRLHPGKRSPFSREAKLLHLGRTLLPHRVLHTHCAITYAADAARFPLTGNVLPLGSWGSESMGTEMPVVESKSKAKSGGNVGIWKLGAWTRPKNKRTDRLHVLSGAFEPSAPT